MQLCSWWMSWNTKHMEVPGWVNKLGRMLQKYLATHVCVSVTSAEWLLYRGFQKRCFQGAPWKPQKIRATLSPPSSLPKFLWKQMCQSIGITVTKAQRGPAKLVPGVFGEPESNDWGWAPNRLTKGMAIKHQGREKINEDFTNMIISGHHCIKFNWVLGLLGKRMPAKQLAC